MLTQASLRQGFLYLGTNTPRANPTAQDAPPPAQHGPPRPTKGELPRLPLHNRPPHGALLSSCLSPGRLSATAGSQAHHHHWQEVPAGDPATSVATQAVHRPAQLCPGGLGNTAQGQPTGNSQLGRAGVPAISNSTGGSGSEGHKARSSRNHKIRMGKPCGHTGGYRVKTGVEMGLAWYGAPTECSTKQEIARLTKFPTASQPLHVGDERQSKKGPYKCTHVHAMSFALLLWTEEGNFGNSWGRRWVFLSHLTFCQSE